MTQPSLIAEIRDFLEQHHLERCDYNAMIGELVFYEHGQMHDRWHYPEGTDFYKKWVYFENALVRERFADFEVYLYSGEDPML